MLALRTRAFPAGNGEGLNLDFEGIVAGCDGERTGKTAKKERRLGSRSKRGDSRSLSMLRF
jgi:hypothetical protein